MASRPRAAAGASMASALVTLDDFMNPDLHRARVSNTKAQEAALRVREASTRACSHPCQYADLRVERRRARLLAKQLNDIRKGIPQQRVQREALRTRMACMMAARTQPAGFASTGKAARQRHTSMDDVFKGLAPLLKKTPASKSLVVRSAPKTLQDVQRLILDRFEHRVAGKPLPLYVNPVDTCACGAQMYVNTNENVMVCPREGCRVKRQADSAHVASLQAIPVADSVDFTHARDSSSVEARTELWMQRTQALEAGSHSRGARVGAG